MANMSDIGGKLNKYAVNQDSLSYTPTYDREGIITQIIITDIDGPDVWTVSVGSKEIMRAEALNPGFNSVFSSPRNGTGYFEPSLFTFLDTYSDINAYIPVPRGMTLEIASLGGAKADVLIIGRELTPNSINPQMINHYQGSRYVVPVLGKLSASVTAVGEHLVDTVVKSPWIPDTFTDLPMRAGWRARLLAVLIDGLSVNTYSGTANKLSSLEYVKFVLNGEILFTHDGTGLFVMSAIAAAGSANKVHSGGLATAPPLSVLVVPCNEPFQPNLDLSPGDNLEVYFGITGDVTGGADYSEASVLQILELMQGG